MSWCFMQIAGKKLIAMPINSHINILDLRDMITLATILPSGHVHAIHHTAWTDRRSMLASISRFQLIVHVPENTTGDRAWTCVWKTDLQIHVVRSITWSADGDAMLGVGRGIQMWERSFKFSDHRPSFHSVWADPTRDWHQAEFAGNRAIFATLETHASVVTIWKRVKIDAVTNIPSHGYESSEIGHFCKVLDFGWKPWHGNRNTSAAWISQPSTIQQSRKVGWYEAPRVLFTLDEQHVVRIWMEVYDAYEDNRSSEFMICATLNMLPFVMVRWLRSQPRALSDDRFRNVNKGVADANVSYDWLSCVDDQGIMHLFKMGQLEKNVSSIEARTPVIDVTKTEFQLQIIGQDKNENRDLLFAPPQQCKHHHPALTVSEMYVMGYFAQSLVGSPTSIYIIFRRSDHILVSYHVVVAKGLKRPEITNRAWQRGHCGHIEAITAHPSLPLIATVSSKVTRTTATGSVAYPGEIMIFWMPLSTSSTNFLGLRPSGIICCPEQNGPVRCITWAPSSHVESIPILLVIYYGGIIEAHTVYPKKISAMVQSPKVTRLSLSQSPMFNEPQRPSEPRSPIYHPWSFYEQSTGRVGLEYEVVLQADMAHGIGLILNEIDGKVVVTRFKKHPTTQQMLPAEKSGKITLFDEFVGVNGIDLRHKMLFEVLHQVRSADRKDPISIRLRSLQDAINHDDMDDTLSKNPFIQENTLSNELSLIKERNSGLSPAIAGSINLFGGWHQIGETCISDEAYLLSNVIAPTYFSDTGDYADGQVVVFAIGVSKHQQPTNTKRLYCWSGSWKDSNQFSFQRLQIEGLSESTSKEICSICTERDYRKRIFVVDESRRRRNPAEKGFLKNSELQDKRSCILVIGDIYGTIHHFQCQTQNSDAIKFHLVGSTEIKTKEKKREKKDEERPFKNATNLSAAAVTNTNVLQLRGHLLFSDTADNPSQPSQQTLQSTLYPFPSSISHIEMDDPNRLAFVLQDSPNDLVIYECASSLGHFRQEEVITGKSPIRGFTWCPGHVEFHSDVLAIQYTDGTIWTYAFDTCDHHWKATGPCVKSCYPIFECTRDATALIVGCGKTFTEIEKAEDFLNSSHEIEKYGQNDLPQVVGSWDTNSIKNHSSTPLKEEAAEKQVIDSDDLPDWHPHALMVDLFGFCSHLGDADAFITRDQPTYSFSQSFAKLVLMLKLFAKVLQNENSIIQSMKNGILVCCKERDSDIYVEMRNQDDGRQSTINQYIQAHTAQSAKASDLFSMKQEFSSSSYFGNASPLFLSEEKHYLEDKLNYWWAQAQGSSMIDHGSSSVLLFQSFTLDQYLEYKGLIEFVYQIQTLGFTSEKNIGLDLPGIRFFSLYFITKQIHLQWTKYQSKQQQGIKGEQRLVQQIKCSSAFLWAFHSESQSFLVQQCFPMNCLWEDVGYLWPGLWIRDVDQLKSIFERCAKCLFTRTKDAMSVSFYYIALGKQKLLASLARLSTSATNQNLKEFLSQDFSKKRWQDAAIKNGYSLLRKKQYEGAMAMFLLPETPALQIALRICVNHLHDPSLALIIGRIVESRKNMDIENFHRHTIIDGVGGITQQFIRQDLIPHFRDQQHDRWMESVAYWWIQDKSQAISTLLPRAQWVDETEAVDDSISTRPFKKVFHLVNLTSLSMYFQFIYTHQQHSVLIQPKNLEHAFSFSAYVCKRNGLMTIAMLQMLQVRHLIDLHQNSAAEEVELSSSVISPTKSDTWVKTKAMVGTEEPISSAVIEDSFASSIFDTFTSRSGPSALAEDRAHFDNETVPKGENTATEHVLNSSSSACHGDVTASVSSHYCYVLENRRWSCSAFISPIVGRFIARQLIVQVNASIFKSSTRMDEPSSSDSSPHQVFLTMLCQPLCAHFHVEREYLLDGALMIVQPHAQHHIAACAILLQELGRISVMLEWIEYLALHVLQLGQTITITIMNAQVFQEWRWITLEFLYLQQLAAEEALSITTSISALLAAAIRMGLIVMGWASRKDALVREMLEHPLESWNVMTERWPGPSSSLHLEYWKENTKFSRAFSTHDISSSSRMNLRSFRYAFKTHQMKEDENQYYYYENPTTSKDDESRKSYHISAETRNHVYMIVLMVQIVRTLYCQMQRFLPPRDDLNISDEDVVPMGKSGSNYSHALYIPAVLWKNWMHKPFDGIKIWFTAMETYLHTTLQNLTKATPCPCGLYGLDQCYSTTKSREIKASVMSLSSSLADPLSLSHEMIYCLMQDPEKGVPQIQLSFRSDLRLVLEGCFSFHDASKWLERYHMCPSSALDLLTSLCQERKIRQVLPVSDPHQELFYTFISPWEVEASKNVATYCRSTKSELNETKSRLELGWNQLWIESSPPPHAQVPPAFDPELTDLWTSVHGHGWILTAMTQFDTDGVYNLASPILDSEEHTERKPYLCDLFSHVQRNQLFHEMKIPYRFIATIDVRLIAGMDLLSTNLLSHSSDPYVFIQLVHARSTPQHHHHHQSFHSWKLSTYRSRMGHGGTNPVWATAEDVFSFRLALPVHPSTTTSAHEFTTTKAGHSMSLADQCQLLHQTFHGPPTELDVTMYSKSKIRAHPFLGHTRIPLTNLTSKTPLDITAPLQGVSSGSIRVGISLHFQLLFCPSSCDDDNPSSETPVPRPFLQDKNQLVTSSMLIDPNMFLMQPPMTHL